MPFAAGDRFTPDPQLYSKSSAMIRAQGFNKSIVRRRSSNRLQPFLKRGLVIRAYHCRRIDGDQLVPELAAQEPLGHRGPAVDVEYSDQGFVSIGQQRAFAPAASLFFAAVQENVASQIDYLGELCQARLAHKVSFHLRKFSFGDVGELFEEPGAYHEAKH